MILVGFYGIQTTQLWLLFFSNKFYVNVMRSFNLFKLLIHFVYLGNLCKKPLANVQLVTVYLDEVQVGFKILYWYVGGR